MLSIVEAKYLENYKLSLRFNDNKTKDVDLRNMVFDDHRKIFQELQDIDKFKDFELKMDTVVWSNGLDIAPEYFYNLPALEIRRCNASSYVGNSNISDIRF